MNFKEEKILNEILLMLIFTYFIFFVYLRWKQFFGYHLNDLWIETFPLSLSYSNAVVVFTPIWWNNLILIFQKAISFEENSNF